MRNEELASRLPVSVSGGSEDEGGRDEVMEGVDVGWNGTGAL